MHGSPDPHAQIGTLHVAGALNERPDDDGAVGNRHARWVCGLIGAWEPDDGRDAENQAWIRDSWERLEPFTSGNYINFQTADESEDRIRASYGENYERLLELKRAMTRTTCPVEPEPPGVTVDAVEPS